MNENIAASHVVKRFYANSFADPLAQLFWENDRLYCGITGHRANLLKLLWEEGVLQGLSKLGLLAEVEPSADAGTEYEFTLKLSASLRVSYCHEWCPEMWKAGALHIIELLGTLAEFELTIQHLQPWHLLFDGTRPVYINPGSITYLTDQTFQRVIEQLSEFFLHTIALGIAGKSNLARRLLRGATCGISIHDFPEVEMFDAKITKRSEAMSPTDCLQMLKREVEGIHITDVDSEWMTYYSSDMLSTPTEDWTYKQRTVYSILNEMRPQSVLDIACNTGRYSMLAARVASEVISADFDETCMNMLYRQVRNVQPEILPIIMDINDPTPGFGVENNWFPPAIERFRSDFVLALAVSHHLVFSGVKLDLNQLVRAFAPFSNRWLLIEFIPLDSEGMIYLINDRHECAGWYKLDSFVAALSTQFSSVKVLPGDPLSRRLILCER